jgi:pimeloyl-ACP methyl ester carboxylesterase
VVSGIYKSAAGARAIREQYTDLLRRWPAPNEQLRLPTSQGETFVVASGPANAAPVMLFQGSGANAAMWMRDVALWARHFRLYAVDMIGEPGLSAESRPALSSDAYAVWLDDVMKGLSLARASFVGVSLGGWLALDYAVRRPEKVKALVLISPSGIGRDRLTFLFKAIPLLMAGRWGRRKLLQMVARASSTDPGAADLEMGRFVSLIFKHFRPRLEKKPIFGDDVLRRLAMPLLLIVGGKDVMLDSADTRRRVEELLPRASVHFLPDSGHVIRDQGERILEFLR